jgi:GH15 family glucan-1,4-alpha-glucosidase
VTQAPINDYGVIGDLYTAALVGRHGGLDWLCAPRFDSPSVFAALLDETKGGSWRIAPTGDATGEQRYLPGTNILVTTFRVGTGGVLEVTDCMPVGPVRQHGTEVLRRVHCTRGSVDVAIGFNPRFDYGQQPTHLHRRAAGLLATDADNDVATISTDASLDWQLTDGRADAHLTLEGGQRVWFVLRFDDDEVFPVAEYQPQEKLDATARWWDTWSARIAYQGPYRHEVERSALALKLCCYEPTGAIVAAPTTSLPEAPGGTRNWDYRFTWLRDSAFTLYSLDLLGYDGEAGAFMRFLKRVCRRVSGGHLQIMFGVDGRRDLSEQILDHFSGYRGAHPVRVGNGAANQFQMDVYGELLQTANIWQRRHGLREGDWKVFRDLVDWVAVHWREPDSSIWEPRHEPKHYVYSKVMAWVALDRGARLSRSLKLPGDADRWEREAALLHAEILERGWDPGRQTFVQAYGEPQLDAAALVISKARFLPRADPRIRTTLAAVRRELTSSCEDLIYRYRVDDGIDHGGREGAFVICSLWVVQNLAMTGQHAEAERLFKNLLRRAGPLGLLAEEIDPETGEQLGNYPQALSHAALINTAFILEKMRPPLD